MHDLSQALRNVARHQQLPDGEPVETVDGPSVQTVATTFGLSLRDVELAALAADIVPLRYIRNLKTYTRQDQHALLSATVGLVGLGGLGGYILELLARAGVGTIWGADGDAFEESNLNRQLLSQSGDLSRPKAEAARDRVLSINPSVTFHGEPSFLTESSMEKFLAPASVCIDALGGHADRPTLSRVATNRNLPLVTGAVAGNTGFVATVLPGETSPFSLFSEGSGSSAEDVLGCQAPSVALVASIQANEVLRLVTGKQAALVGKVLVMDLTDMTFEIMHLTA
ncbi:HesA/MoeB/ThiF family protein [Desulfovibrio inopinatus]|uniref:HesA/MoeB/ThiF family protein n=1 Tax=Desulfovibrio inopinatus TaxID=102109 RepID=UPI000415DDFB|nr:ThiF family adenylyltransferase [Desulfovibrio inopinatus]